MDETTVERLLRKQIEEDQGGRPLTGRARTAQRSVEDYLKAGVRPRWMERLTEIERGTRGERRRLERAHRALSARHAGDPAASPAPGAPSPPPSASTTSTSSSASTTSG